MRLDFHKNHRLLFGVVCLGFIGLSYLAAIGPALSARHHSEPLPGSRPMSDLERQGLGVYLSEGCVYCHTQQVRPLPQDTLRYGRASRPDDFARIAPQGFWRQAPRVLGTERTGPDLTNIGVRQPSEVWQYIHLYQPRSVVPGSVMPAFPWLFAARSAAAPGDVVVPLPPSVAPARGVVVARPAAQALVAYLISLQQTPIEADTAAAAPASSGHDVGAAIYETRCSSCHQPSGEGIAGAFPPLAGDPVVTAVDPTRHVEIVLFGVSGSLIGGVHYASPMPAWGAQLTDEEVAEVVNHERTSWGNAAPTVTPAVVTEIRKRGANAQ